MIPIVATFDHDQFSPFLPTLNKCPSSVPTLCVFNSENFKKMQQRTMADFICIALIIFVYDGKKTLLLAVLVPDFLCQTFYHRESLR